MPEHSASSRPRRRRRHSRGLVLLALLLALALASIALLAGSEVWSAARQRAQEQELLFVGDQYRQAIQRYYFGAPPGTARVLPARFEDLLGDDRYPLPVRYLRRLYPDPITGSANWGVVHFGDRIAGIYSLSEKTPMKQAEFPPGYEPFNGKKSYRDWVFAVSPTDGFVPGGPAPAGMPVGAAAPSTFPRLIGKSPS
jgi:type II secretory pathway pseudopilin PulG